MSLPVVRVYISVGAPIHGRSLLERIAPCSYSVFGWNMLIRRSLQFGFYEEALDHFQRMMRLGWRPDHYTFPFVLKACGELPSFRRGGSVHAVLYVNGFEWNVFVCNAVVAMYGRCGEISDARKAFDEILKREMADLVSWNSIVAAHVHAGDARTAVKLFGKMIDDVSITPDVISLVNVLPACATMGASLRGRQVHGFALRRGLLEDVFVGNAVLDMYAKCGMLDEASTVFSLMDVKDVVSWNAMVTGYSQVGRFEDALGLFEKMEEQKIELNVVTWSAVIAGYAQRGLGYEALNVFRRMILSGSKPNVVTLVSLLSGCASAEALLNGKETQCYAIKQVLRQRGSDPGDDLMVINAIIDMYAKCKSLTVARSMFNSIAPEFRNVVTWTAMIGGYAQHGDANDALKLFPQMFQQTDFIKPNAFTLSCALMACSRLGALRSGREIHAYVLRNQYWVLTTHINNCLIDMYSKSAHIDAARAVFNYMHEKNNISWTSLMTGYGMHGRGEEAIRIFNEMRRQGLVLDGVTFVVLLYACSHSGMVDQGSDYFNAMEKDFGVEPGVEHYACMVDLIGRAGRLGESMKLIKNMPMKPTPIVWFSLLSACRLHGNVEFGEYAANKLMELESGNDGSYTLLSNIYANAKQWKDVARVRSFMKSTGIRKRPGASWVQGNKGTATFFVGDRTHPQSQKIYDLLANLMHKIKAIGYVPQISYALHDVDDEEKGDLLFEHSEKIALAYAILTSTPGATIRITKNLRVCGDCHSAITYISMLIDHEIILRDSSRFHHFKKGTCSCRGYW